MSENQTIYVCKSSAESYKVLTPRKLPGCVSSPNPNEHNQERPMMLNAWSQTCIEDFDFAFRANDYLSKAEQKEREKKLLEKIRGLEENVRAHSELLSQIHATSARTSALQAQYMQQQKQQHVIVDVQQQQQQRQEHHHNHQPILNLQLQQQVQLPQQPEQVHIPQDQQEYTFNTISGSIINQQIPSQADSIKYTIVSENCDISSGEPIEIQLAEEDGALNLNHSEDSERLEICLQDEFTDIKNDINDNGVQLVVDENSSAQTQSLHTLQDVTQQNKRDLVQQEQQSERNISFKPKRSRVEPSNHNDYDRNNYVNSTPPQQPNVISGNTKRSSGSGSGERKTRSHNSGGNGHPSPVSVAIDNPTTSKFNGKNSLNGYGQKKDTEALVMVSIGPNNTRIPAKLYESMNWSSASIATRKLLMSVFDRNTLATHSMTGKPSPAFKDHGKPLKQMLDPRAIQDIIFAVTRKCNVSEKEVRNAITTKCADENKMMKLQMSKNRSIIEMNKENVHGMNKLEN